MVAYEHDIRAIRVHVCLRENASPSLFTCSTTRVTRAATVNRHPSCRLMRITPTCDRRKEISWNVHRFVRRYYWLSGKFLRFYDSWRGWKVEDVINSTPIISCHFWRIIACWGKILLRSYDYCWQQWNLRQ